VVKQLYAPQNKALRAKEKREYDPTSRPNDNTGRRGYGRSLSLE
jgi:hypothetical protein